MAEKPDKKQFRLDMAHNLVENLRYVYDMNVGSGEGAKLNGAFINHSRYEGEGGESYSVEDNDPLRDTLSKLEESLSEGEFDSARAALDDLGEVIGEYASNFPNVSSYNEFIDYFQKLQENLGSHVDNSGYVNSESKNKE